MKIELEIDDKLAARMLHTAIKTETPGATQSIILTNYIRKAHAVVEVLSNLANDGIVSVRDHRNNTMEKFSLKLNE